MFYNLTVKEVKKETPDTVSVSFDIPDNLKEHFRYTQGQYLTFKKNLFGEELRRSYSLCSSPVTDNELRVAIKEVEGGRFSGYANSKLSAGDVLESMTPMGNFFTEVKEGQKKNYVFFAAGSGITPVISIIKTILAVETESTVLLVYGNRDKNSIIFKDELSQIKEAHGDRLTMVYALSRETEVNGAINSRITPAICPEINTRYGTLYQADEYFLCGPEEMIQSITDHLKSSDVNADKIHFELFTTPVTAPETNEDDASEEITSEVMVIMDDEEFEFQLSSKGESILDASIEAGVDAPFSCKGAVCCTCKAKVVEGSARMAMNYALDDYEVQEGYILTCQAHPTSEKLVVDYDVI
ncbi:2Fe-2S iron-sulfur cluster binding domain-containing protein [bacterium SCSIO 12741]|nr:2Fe-2S iron-sulfur cluster binding domain-containing protein [bacterium SCSIO 12741]